MTATAQDSSYYLTPYGGGYSATMPGSGGYYFDGGSSGDDSGQYGRGGGYTEDASSGYGYYDWEVEGRGGQ